MGNRKAVLVAAVAVTLAAAGTIGITTASASGDQSRRARGPPCT
ncbi:hypothetical protein ABZU76_11960 [Amycolatopsis sp. NPDC005232]